MPVVQLPSPDGVATLGAAGRSMFLCYDRTDAEYRDDFTHHVEALGYRVLDVCGYPTSTGTRYSAIFEEADAGPDAGPAQWSDHKIAAADLDTATSNQKAAGMRLRLTNTNNASTLTGLNQLMWASETASTSGTHPPTACGDLVAIPGP